MTHPTVYELARFVETGGELPDFERHVQTCEECASRLSRLAQRALAARGLSEVASVPVAAPPAVLPMLVALFACLAVLVSTPTRAAMGPQVSPSAPLAELHGTPEPTSTVTLPATWGEDAGPGSRSD